MKKALNRFIPFFLVTVVGAFIVLSTHPASAAEKKTKYVGSDVCATCHRIQHNDFVISGHPYKLRKAEDARKQGLPLPEGYTWDDISYVVGGRNWKTRYVDKKGYIITSTGPKRDKPGKNQFNLETGTWSNYHAGEKNKPYNCGRCHTTGYSKKGHQDGLPGMIGTWAATGVQCEACHGPGGDHVAKGGDKKLIKIDSSKKNVRAVPCQGEGHQNPRQRGFHSPSRTVQRITGEQA